jgi:hypothetical protein
VRKDPQVSEAFCRGIRGKKCRTPTPAVFAETAGLITEKVSPALHPYVFFQSDDVHRIESPLVRFE